MQRNDHTGSRVTDGQKASTLLILESTILTLETLWPLILSSWLRLPVNQPTQIRMPMILIFIMVLNGILFLNCDITTLEATADPSRHKRSSALRYTDRKIANKIL